MRLFAYRLALAMGRLDVDAMLSEMTVPQLLGWMRYYRADPWGEERADLRNASLMALLYNRFRGKGPPRKVRDFMPRFRPRQTQSPEQMLGMLQAAQVLANQRQRGK